MKKEAESKERRRYGPLSKAISRRIQIELHRITKLLSDDAVNVDTQTLNANPIGNAFADPSPSRTTPNVQGLSRSL